MNENTSGISYFELQAYMGTTKHMGGMQTTQRLIDLCAIGAGTRVLDIGCGAGATPAYLAKILGAHVTAVDLRPEMIALTRQRAVREGAGAQIDARVADAQALPFAGAVFDVVLCESVATFIEDKARVAREFARVVQPGGRVGLNEEVWREPPPPEVRDYARRTWAIGAEIPTLAQWQAILSAAGFDPIDVYPYAYNVGRESSQVKRYHLRDLWRMAHRTLKLSLTSRTFRAYMAERKRIPPNLFRYLGYALLIGHT